MVEMIQNDNRFIGETFRVHSDRLKIFERTYIYDISDALARTEVEYN